MKKGRFPASPIRWNTLRLRGVYGGMRGKLRLATPITILALLLCPAAVAQDGAQLFHKMQAALGGAEKIASIHDYEECARADTWYSDGHSHGEVRKHTRWIRPNFLRIDQVGLGDTYVLFFNGTTGWEILPDKSVHDLAGGELKFAQNYLQGFDLNFWLADRDPRYTFTAAAPDVVGISFAGDPTRRTEITLDPRTFLPVKQDSVSLADPSHPVGAETRMSRWRAVDGVKFAQRISIAHGGKTLAVGTVEETLVNRGLDPAALARKPADLKPVMSCPAK